MIVAFGFVDEPDEVPQSDPKPASDYDRAVAALEAAWADAVKERTYRAPRPDDELDYDDLRRHPDIGWGNL